MRVDDARVRRERDRALEIGGAPGKDNPAVSLRERAVGDDLETALIGPSPRRGAGAGDQLAAVAQDQHGGAVRVPSQPRLADRRPV